MHGNSPNYYGRILVILHRLKELYPTYNLGRHLSTVLDDCGDVWGITDHALLLELQKYKRQLEIDVIHDDDIDKIINDGMHLYNVVHNDEEEETDGDF